MMRPGHVVNERFRIERELGRGAVATVYRAVDEATGDTVAIKCLRSLDDAVQQRFAREARAWRQLDHPGIVRLVDGPFSVEIDALRCVTGIALRYVGGGTLATLGADVGTMSDDELLELLDPLARALAYLHDRGIVHRDIKPTNIMVDERGMPLLTDFGIAHLQDATRLTTVGDVLGTPGFAAPEQLLGADPLPAWDIHALGRTMQALGAASSESTLGALIDAMTREDPQERPADGSALLQLIGAATDDGTGGADGSGDLVDGPAGVPVPPTADDLATRAAAGAAAGAAPEAATASRPTSHGPVDTRLLGRMVDDRYELRRRLGSGATSVVYRATDHKLGADVAIKFLLVPASADNVAREAAAVASLEHPGIVRVRDWGTWIHEGIEDAYLVLDLVDGSTLQEVIERGVGPDHALELAAQVLDSLAHAHAAGVVHGDVKPVNILVDRAGRARLADFGIGAMIGDDAFAGSLPWAAPELLDNGATTAASDTWAAAVVVFELLAGTRPFDGATPTAMAEAFAAGPRTDALSSEHLREVFSRALDVDPSRRFWSAAELRRRLLAAADAAAAAPATIDAHERLPSDAVDPVDDSEDDDEPSMELSRASRALAAVASVASILVLAGAAITIAGSA